MSWKCLKGISIASSFPFALWALGEVFQMQRPVQTPSLQAVRKDSYKPGFAGFERQVPQCAETAVWEEIWMSILQIGGFESSYHILLHTLEG